MLDKKPRIKSNTTTKVIAGEGMPISKHPGQKADPVMTYEVNFPKEELTDEQKEKVRSAFPSPVSNTRGHV